MTERQICIGVTGATGYIGARVMAQALKAGHKVIALSRKEPHAQPGAGAVQWVPFDLTETDPVVLGQEVDAIVHLAADTAASPGETDAETQAAKRLIAAAEQHTAKLIFISSQTARPDAPSLVRFLERLTGRPEDRTARR